jgi:hypothetical protein
MFVNIGEKSGLWDKFSSEEIILEMIFQKDCFMVTCETIQTTVDYRVANN